MVLAIAFGALFASIAPLYAMWLQLRRSLSSEQSTTLAGRVKELERQLEHCRARVDELERENMRLMRQILS